jgi:hypothetical protein
VSRRSFESHRWCNVECGAGFSRDATALARDDALAVVVRAMHDKNLASFCWRCVIEIVSRSLVRSHDCCVDKAAHTTTIAALRSELATLLESHVSTIKLSSISMSSRLQHARDTHNEHKHPRHVATRRPIA